MESNGSMNSYSFPTLAGPNYLVDYSQPSSFSLIMSSFHPDSQVYTYRGLPDGGSVTLISCASPGVSQGSVLKILMSSWPRFIVFLYNVLAIKLIYDTYLGTVKSLSKAVACLSMYFLGHVLVIGYFGLPLWNLKHRKEVT